MSGALITGSNNSTVGSSNSGSDAVSSALGDSELGQMFLKLLVAEVQYQDPLEPTDTSTFVTQLSQLSQTESLQSMQSQMSTQSTMLDSIQTMQLGAQVGSQVMVSSSNVLLDGDAVSATVNLPNAAQLSLQLTASNGAVTQIDLGTQAAGDVSFTIDPVALGLPAGRYALAVTDASDVSYATEIGGRLNAVRLTSAGTVALQVQGLGDVAASSITRFVGQKSS